MKLTELKIKRKTLAAEARLIRTEEAKALNKGRFGNAMSNPDMTEKRLAKLNLTKGQLRRVRARMEDRVNTPVYAAANGYALFNALRDHRTMNVRTAARAAHLAHHYLKGDAYSLTEQGTRDTPQMLATLAVYVAQNARTFGSGPNGEAKPKDVLFWMEGGKTLAQEAAETEDTVAAE